MTERRCPECARGFHLECSGAYRWVPCACTWCKAWEDEHGPFSVPGIEPERAS